MLRSINELHGYTLHATDGDLGHVDEFYFDHEKWAVRYLVVNTGGWLLGRKVLISPLAFRAVDWDNGRFQVALTRAEVEASPAIDTEATLSRRDEGHYFRFFGWPFYWTGAGLWGGAAMYPALAVPPGTAHVAEETAELPPDEEENDSRLLSSRHVTGWKVQATDGDVGHVADFIVDDRSWGMSYLVVDTGGWIGGRKVLVPAEHIDRTGPFDDTLNVLLARADIEHAPEWDGRTPLSEDLDERLRASFGEIGDPGGRTAAV